MTLETLILLSLLMCCIVTVNCYFIFNRTKYIKVENERKGIIIAALAELSQEQLNEIYAKAQEGVFKDV